MDYYGLKQASADADTALAALVAALGRRKEALAAASRLNPSVIGQLGHHRTVDRVLRSAGLGQHATIAYAGGGETTFSEQAYQLVGTEMEDSY